MIQPPLPEPPVFPVPGGSTCVLALNLHSTRTAPTSQLKKLKPRIANKTLKGTVLEDPGLSDHIGCTPLQGNGGESCLLGFDGIASYGNCFCSSATGWSLSVMIPGPPARHRDTGAEMQSWMLPSPSGKLRNADMDVPCSPSLPPATQEWLPRHQGDCLLETATLCEVPHHCSASPCQLMRTTAKAHDFRGTESS